MSMILMTTKTIKILLFLAAWGGSWLLFRKRLPKKAFAGFGVAVAVFALAANMLSGYVPPLTDEVTLTALGETGANSNGCEVVAAGFQVDGQSYPLGKVAEGKWFWCGSDLSLYAWRIETDPRQPEGMTRTVVLEIPVGTDREVLFSLGGNRGFAEITAGGATQLVDTSVTASIQIGRSSSYDLIWNQIRRLAVYACALLLLSGCAAVWVWKEKYKTVRPLYVVRIIIPIAAFMMMLHYAGKISLWLDDLHTVGFVSTQKDLPTIVKHVLIEGRANPPLFYIFAYFWLRVAPFGTTWLKLPSIVFTSLGIWFCGVAADRIKGERAAVITEIIGAASGYLTNYAAYTFRSYGLLFMLSALLIVAYHRRLTQPEKVSSHIWYGVVMTLLLYTNYISVFFLAPIGLYDCWLLYKKKIKLNCIWSYTGGVFCFCPSLSMNLPGYLKNWTITGLQYQISIP